MTTIQLSEAEQKMIERTRKRKEDAKAARTKARAEKAEKESAKLAVDWLDMGGPTLSIQNRRFICQAEAGKDSTTLHILDAKGAPLFTIGVKKNKDGTYVRPDVKAAAPAKKKAS